jgi:hypothetical protein
LGQALHKNTHEELVKKALKKPGVKRAYDELEEEFALLREMVKARHKSGKTSGRCSESYENNDVCYWKVRNWW